MKTVYMFDPVTGIFEGTYAAHPSPEEPGVYITPIYSTESPVPSLADGERAILQPDGVTWVVELAPVADPVPSASADQIRRAEILNELAIIDYASMRPARAVALAVGQGQTLGSDFSDLAKLAELESRAVDLRAELAALPTE